MNPCEITASVTAIGNALACQFSDEQLDLAAAVFTQLGDTLATISAARGLCANSAPRAEKDSKASIQEPEKTEPSIPGGESGSLDTPAANCLIPPKHTGSRQVRLTEKQTNIPPVR